MQANSRYLFCNNHDRRRRKDRKENEDNPLNENSIDGNFEIGMSTYALKDLQLAYELL